MSSVVKYITVAVCIVVVTCQRSPLVSAIHTKTYCDYLLLESTLLGQYSTPFGEAIGLKYTRHTPTMVGAKNIKMHF
jgi:hypothetical protein